MQRLNDFTGLPPAIQTPGYDPSRHDAGIVHFGIGAFHRAHMAAYTDSLLAADGGDWRISGISLRSGGVRDRLAPQNCLYTLVERSDRGESYRVIGSVKEVLVAAEDPAAVFDRLVAATTRIVSMTITEKGYLRDPASGALMTDHPDIRHDLAHPDRPVTMHGYVVEALRRIKRNGACPFALLCCDNLPENGTSLKRVIVQFAGLSDQALAEWIAREIVFPNTMVDRIVPATTEDDLAEVTRKLGRFDAAPVICEPFSQWVIADCLPQPRPAWDKFGASFVRDVAPFEKMKLRLLNGAHSTMAYLGYLGGYEYIHQVIADPDYLGFVKAMLREEVVPTLQMPADIDLNAYCTTLVARFRNPALRHRTWQIAMDGSVKLPQRLLDTIRDRKFAQKPVRRLTLAVAGWLRYVTGIDEQGQAVEVSDPFAARLRALADRQAGDVPGYVRAILDIREIFGSDLAVQASFRDELVETLQALYRLGARRAVRELSR